MKTDPSQRQLENIRQPNIKLIDLVKLVNYLFYQRLEIFFLPARLELYFLTPEYRMKSKSPKYYKMQIVLLRFSKTKNYELRSLFKPRLEVQGPWRVRGRR